MQKTEQVFSGEGWITRPVYEQKQDFTNLDKIPEEKEINWENCQITIINYE